MIDSAGDVCACSNITVNLCSSHQEELPAAGVMVAPPAASQPAPADMQSMFEEYMRTRTRHNWKFWIVSFRSNQRYALLVNSDIGI